MSKQDQTKVVRELIIQNPELPLFFMYSEESSDRAYTSGEVSSAEIGKYFTRDEDVLLLSEDEDQLREYQADLLWEEVFGHNEMSEADHERMEELLDQYIKELPWQEAIIVYIDPKMAER